MKKLQKIYIHINYTQILNICQLCTIDLKCEMFWRQHWRYVHNFYAVMSYILTDNNEDLFRVLVWSEDDPY